MFKDGQDLERDAVLEVDVAIVGAGMAGITLAQELAGLDVRVCLIESGGFDPEWSSQALFAADSVGRDYYRLDRCRYRVFGGSSVRWGGFCRPLEELDFAARDWIPHSGWPITMTDLSGGYQRATRMLGLAGPSFEVDGWDGRLPRPPAIAGPELEPSLIQISPRYDFGVRARQQLAQAANVDVLLHANVIGLDLEPGTRRVRRARVAIGRGGHVEVLARTFVLAAGAIENARLLLASHADDGGVWLGDESDWVGRCFMEHLHRPFGYIVPAERSELPAFFERTPMQDARVQGVLAPSSAALRTRAAPSCTFTLGTVPDVMRTAPLINVPAPALAGYRRLRRHLPRLSAALRGRVIVTSGVPHRVRTFHDARRAARRARREVYTVYVRAEQTPNRDSRVTLSDRRDRLGMPQARLDWRVSDSDLAAIRTWSGVLDQSLRRTGFGRFVPPLPGWEDSLLGGPHHLGTTRMSATAHGGVVDADCRVHSVENLYVAGSSVFVTGGHANPSLTILALTLRLADHLRDRLAVNARASALAATDDAPT